MVAIKDHLLCRKCGGDWQNTELKKQVVCPYCGARKDARDRSDEAKRAKEYGERKTRLERWYAEKDNRLARSRKSRDLLRKRVLFKVGGSINPACVRCGCDDSRLLEVNHKNGGGGQETDHGKKSMRFYLDIANGKRKTDDLELLCKPCNAIHCLELKHGPLPMKVVWNP